MSKRVYTQYVSPAPNPTAQLLGKLYRTKEGTSNPYAEFQLSGDQEGATNYFRQVGEQFLQSQTQTGNPQFPEGVRMDYVGDVDGNDPSVPNLSEVEWKAAGGPANGYYPDITSPGTPGRIDPLSRDTNPELTTGDIDPNWQPGENTKTPSNGSENKIYVANKLTDRTIEPGTSGDNE